MRGFRGGKEVMMVPDAIKELVMLAQVLFLVTAPSWSWSDPSQARRVRFLGLIAAALLISDLLFGS